MLRAHPSIRAAGRKLWQISRDVPRLIPIQKIPALQRWSGRPVGYYTTVGEYLAAYPARGWQKVMRPGGSYERARPIPIGGIPLPARFDSPQTVFWPDERVVYLESPRYWGGYGGGLITHDDRILAELSPDVWGIERHALFAQLKMPPLTRLEGLTAIISTPEADTNYSHWMVDLLPRIALLNDAGYSPRVVDRYIVNAGAARYCKETFDLAGIPSEKILTVRARTHLLLQSVVTTSLRDRHWQHSMPNHLPHTLQCLLGVDFPAEAGTRDLYLTRRNCTHRRVLGEDRLIESLESEGFECIEPDRVSLREQADLFASAAFILSAHSSALTNLAFAGRHTTVAEIHPHHYFDVSFWTMASAVGCRYCTAVSSRPSGTRTPGSVMEARGQDIVMDERLLSGVLALKNSTQRQDV